MLLRPAYISLDESLEGYLATKRKELKDNKCEVCHITNVVRSCHCPYCNRYLDDLRVAALPNGRSTASGTSGLQTWGRFNKCIDARNLLTYWLYILVALVINCVR